jgi:hypothetical protein
MAMWKRSSSRAKHFPKTLFSLARCRIAEDEVPETCSLDRWCTLTKCSRQVEACCASSVYFIFLAPAHIYKNR